MKTNYSVIDTYRSSILTRIRSQFNLQYADAEDAFQDAVVTFLTKMEKGEECPTSIEGYLYGICVNKVHEMHKYTERYGDSLRLDDDSTDSAEFLSRTAQAEIANTDVTLCEGHYHSLIHREMLYYAISLLNPTQQRLILADLTVGEGERRPSMEQLAKELGLSGADSAKSLKNKAKRRLVEIIKSLDEDNFSLPEGIDTYYRLVA